MGNLCHAGAVPSPAPPARRALSFGRDATLKREDFVFADARGPSSLLKLPGSVNGQQFLLERCVDCDVFLLDHCAAVQIDDCVGCRIVVGPCESSLFLRNCRDCVVVCAVQQLRTRDCDRVDVMLFSATEPVVELSTEMRFACFPLAYFSLQQQFDKAGFSVWNNRWSEIYNFTPDHGTWKLLPSSCHASPLEEAVERQQDGGLALWRLPSWTAEEVGLTIDAKQLVVPLTSGLPLRNEGEKRVVVVFPAPLNPFMVEFAHAVTNHTEYSDEIPVLLIRTRQMKLSAVQAKALFSKNNQAAQKATAAAKDTTGSVIMEFQGSYSENRVGALVETARFAHDPISCNFVVFSDPQCRRVCDLVFVEWKETI